MEFYVTFYSKMSYINENVINIKCIGGMSLHERISELLDSKTISIEDVSDDDDNSLVMKELCFKLRYEELVKMKCLHLFQDSNKVYVRVDKNSLNKYVYDEASLDSEGKYNLCRRIASQDLMNDWFRDGCPLDWRKKRGFLNLIMEALNA